MYLIYIFIILITGSYQSQRNGSIIQDAVYCTSSGKYIDSNIHILLFICSYININQILIHHRFNKNSIFVFDKLLLKCAIRLNYINYL